MNDILDVFLIRFLFVLIICGLIVLYKYTHFLLYPSSKNQLIKRFYPSRNPAETILIFSRIFGIGLIFSNFKIFLNHGFFYAAFDFILTSTVTFSLYLLSLYILESIALSEFEYTDEITQKNNIPYAMISASYSIGIPIIFRAFLTNSVSENFHSIIYIIFMWCFTIVLLGFAVKSYSFVSKLSLNYLLSQKSYALGFSYFGFFLAWIIIVSSALNQPIVDFKDYGISLILRIILSLLIMPIFKGIIPYIFQIQDDLEINTTVGKLQLPSYGVGIYEGVMFMTSAFMTTLVTSNIVFPSF
jgi:hypothetical protein